MTENEPLLENLIKNCSADSVKAFFRRKNIHFKAQNESLENSDPERFSNLWKIGRLDFEADNVVFAFAEVKTELSERSCRKAQFESARKILRAENADAGLFIFKGANGAFRLSLVYKAYKGTKAELSPYRRFTYFVQPDSAGNATFKRQVGGCPFDSLETIKKSFSLEPVNKEFYSKIQKHFYGLVGGKVENADFTGCMSLPSKPIDQPENHKAYQEFAVRLLGRVVFCWFLKHKRCDQNRPLIPHELLSSEAVEKHSGYYHAVLEKLFFQTLNKPMNERSKYAPEFAHLIPYLNGGLFDPHKDDFYEEGALGISRFAATLKIPDDWFLKLFQTLEQYNFTIDENTSFDTDVSIDPEILGRIFENLLAEINPETGDSARKATGSFYTPREIVDYMVEESLLQHLKTALGLTTEHTENTEGENSSTGGNSVSSVYSVVEKSLRALFVDDDEPHNLDDKTRRAVVDAFRTIKVLDPACGSGAFPVGILQKMLCALRKVDPENDLWLDAQIEQIESIKLSKAEEDRRLREIEDAFKTNEADYGRKLGIIQNSVYGVDIQPIAIEISKLRFFLTLVVDEKINEKEDNRGILPLPNLDFKFVCANTLIPAPEIPDLGREQELGLEFKDTFFDDFTGLTEQYFYAGTPAEKHSIREQLEAVVSAKVKGELDKGFKLSKGLWDDSFAGADKLSKTLRARHKKEQDKLARNASLWGSYKNIFTGETVDFFDPKYMFPDAGAGFDVVISNPPWGAKLTTDEKAIFKEIYPEIDSSTPNSFAYFIGVANRVSQGVKVFILPDSILIKDYAKTRKLLRPNLQEVSWYQNMGVPEEKKLFVNVDHDVCVLFWSMTARESLSCATTLYNSKKGKLEPSRWIADKNAVMHEDFEYVVNMMAKDVDFKILKKLLLHTRMDQFVQCHEGIHTGNCRDVLFRPGKENKFCKPLFYGGGAGDVISNYHSRRSGWFVDYRQEIINKDAGMYASLRDERIFTEPKIYVTRTGKPFKAFFDHDTYASNNFFSLQLKDYRENTSVALKQLLPFIISKVAQYFIRKFAAPRLGNAFIETKIIHLLKFRIPRTTPEQQKEIEGLVEQILALKKETPDEPVSKLEEKIDQLVYKLYNLTDEEVAIVEGK